MITILQSKKSHYSYNRHCPYTSLTHENIEKGLRMAKEYADNHPEQPPLITINAWNEWPESSYLMPDDLYGYGYLETVKRVFGKK